MISFLAEVREVRSKKLVSNDNEITVRLTTDDKEALKLALIDPDSVVKVEFIVDE